MTDRYARGLERLAHIHGEVGERVIAELREVAPDLERYVVEFAFGDVYSRPGLDLRTRQLATIASLTTLGHAQPQLAAHVRGALRAGCTRGEIMEVILQMAVYAGFPAALNAALTAGRVFRDMEG